MPKPRLSDEKRCRSEFVLVKVERHFFDGKPTCVAWAGGEGRRQRVCDFLQQTSGFGLSFHCGALTRPLEHDKNGFIQPPIDCPVWWDRDVEKISEQT